jgi:acyl carrier protein
MNSIDDLVAILRDELGMAVVAEDAGRSFDEIPDWDSVHLLWLLNVVERRTGRSVSLPDVLEARSIGDLYAVMAGE